MPQARPSRHLMKNVLHQKESTDREGPARPVSATGHGDGICVFSKAISQFNTIERTHASYRHLRILEEGMHICHVFYTCPGRVTQASRSLVDIVNSAGSGESCHTSAYPSPGVNDSRCNIGQAQRQYIAQ